MATLFIKCHKNSAAALSIPLIVAAFAQHGVEIEIQQVRVPLFYAGPNEGKPRNFAFVHSISPANVEQLVAMASMTFEGTFFLISELRPRIPARFSDRGIPPAVQPSVLNQQPETKIVPKGQRTKSFDESEFRG